jgi:hypothetical protein
VFKSAGIVGYAKLSTSTLDVLVLNGQEVAVGTNAAVIRAFVAAGGGLLMGNQIWSWSGPAATHPSNILLSPMGIIVSSRWIRGDAVLSPTTPPPQTANVDVGLGCFEATLRGNTSDPCYLASDEGITSAMEHMASAASFIPWGSSTWSRLAEVRRRQGQLG